MKLQLIMLPNPIVVSDEEIKTAFEAGYKQALEDYADKIKPNGEQ